MIEVKGLYKEFDGKTVLEDINIQFRPGECSLIIGASGSGKTVLLKNLVGLYEPDRGEILYGERNFTKMKFAERKLFRKEKRPVRLCNRGGEHHVPDGFLYGMEP